MHSREHHDIEQNEHSNRQRTEENSEPHSLFQLLTRRRKRSKKEEEEEDEGEKEERTEDESIPQDLKINPLGHER